MGDGFFEKFGSIGIPFTIVLVIIALLIIFGGSIISFIQNPKNAIKGLAGFGILALILIISYVTVGDGLVFGNKSFVGEVSPTASKIVGMGLNAFYILFVIAGILFVVDLVKSMLTRN